MPRHLILSRLFTFVVHFLAWNVHLSYNVTTDDAILSYWLSIEGLLDSWRGSNHLVDFLLCVHDQVPHSYKVVVILLMGLRVKCLFFLVRSWLDGRRHIRLLNYFIKRHKWLLRFKFHLWRLNLH